jgi:hypothetical protein
MARGFVNDFGIIDYAFVNILARDFDSNFDIIGYTFVNILAKGHHQLRRS